MGIVHAGEDYVGLILRGATEEMENIQIRDGLDGLDEQAYSSSNSLNSERKTWLPKMFGKYSRDMPHR